MADAVRSGRRVDPLGLRRVLGDRLLPVMVATMAFLAALALGGAMAAQAWADRWRLGAGMALTAQVPRPGEPAPQSGANPLSRLERSLQVLRASPAVATARPLSAAELDELLKPWLGTDAAVPDDLLPAVVAIRAAVHPTGDEARFDQLTEVLAHAVPGASLERHTTWVGRLSELVRALEACAWGTLLLVVAAAALVIGTATRAGLVARRGTVDILHGLGATDGYVARRFARRAMVLSALGGIAGTLGAVPVLLSLERLAQPVAVPSEVNLEEAGGLPVRLWVGLALIPPSVAAIGYATAQGTVRIWLRRLP